MFKCKKVIAYLLLFLTVIAPVVSVQKVFAFSPDMFFPNHRYDENKKPETRPMTEEEIRQTYITMIISFIILVAMIVFMLKMRTETIE